MYSVYVLKNKKSSYLYIGYTNNLKRRLNDHNSNRSKFTQGEGKWGLIYCEIYKSKIDAINREKMLKNYGSSSGHLKKRIKNSLL